MDDSSVDDSVCAQRRSRAAHFIPWLSLVARPQTRKRYCTAAQWQSYSCISRQTRVTAPRERGFGMLTPHSREQGSCRLPSCRYASCTDRSGHRSNREMQPIILPTRCARGGITSGQMYWWRFSPAKPSGAEKVQLDEAIWSPPEVKTPDGLSITLHN